MNDGNNTNANGSIIDDLQGTNTPENMVWIGGICYHAAVLHLPRTNDIPDIVRKFK